MAERDGGETRDLGRGDVFLLPHRNLSVVGTPLRLPRRDTLRPDATVVSVVLRVSRHGELGSVPETGESLMKQERKEDPPASPVVRTDSLYFRGDLPGRGPRVRSGTRHSSQGDPVCGP